MEKPAEIGADVLGSLQLLFWGFLLAVVSGTGFRTSCRLDSESKRGAASLIQCDYTDSAVNVFSVSDYDFSTFRQAAIAVIFFAVFWPTFQGMVARVAQIDKAVIEAARTMGVGTAGMLVKVIFPYCLPGIIKSISKSLRGAFMCLSGAEMLGINLGIGYFIEKYKSFADYRCVLAGIVTVGVITTIIDLAVNKVESTVIRWEG